MDPDKTLQDKEIKEIASSAQVAWFSLLSFLAFYILIILTTSDQDFLSRTKQTQLPFVGVFINSDLFYAAAPMVATGLYFYMHFLCIVLWQRAQNAEADVLQASLSSSLIGAVALALKRGAHPRGMDATQTWTASFSAFPAALLIWAAQPAVLYFSFRASDASSGFVFDAAVTVAGVTISCFAVSAVWGLWSLLNALAIRQPDDANIRMSSVGKLFAHMRHIAGLAAVAVVVAGIAGLVGWWMWNRDTDITVERALLVQTPGGWVSASARRETYRRDWCEAVKIPLAVCPQRPADSAGRNQLAAKRTEFCRSASPAIVDCAAFFADLDRSLPIDFHRVRKAELESVPELDLEKRELGWMRADRVRLVAARLEKADLTKARLSWANLEGAVLIDATMNDLTAQDTAFDEADLTRAILNRAKLPSASLTGAALPGAALDGADLTNANLEYATLGPAAGTDTRIPGPASLNATNLTDAILTGADFSHARLERTILKGADLSGAKFDGTILDADLSDVTGLTQMQLDLAVGGETVVLPPANPPLHIFTCWPEPTEAQRAVIAD